jgi:DNA repair exonuclease SbcCD ATPase subunit
MLASIRVENVRGLCRNVDLGPYTRLSGRNGAGKSAIKEAIAFLFTGRDSLGNQKPLHLISTGSEGLRVEGLTSKGVLITRTLTQKGAGTLRIVQNEAARAITQADLERILCTAETFLAAFVPGYLMRLSKERQLAVLTEVLPQIDRRELLSSLSLIPTSQLPEMNLNKRADILAGDLATKRRALARDLAVLEGQITAYAAQIKTDLTAPAIPAEVAEKALLGSRRATILAYMADKARYDAAVVADTKAVEENRRRGEVRRELTARLQALSFAPIPVEVDEVFETPPTPPAAPSVQAVMESEHCSACGQIVGLKRREAMRAQNKAELEKYEKSEQQYRAALAEYEGRRQSQKQRREATQQELRRVRALNCAVEAEGTVLEQQYRRNEDVPLMELPPEPRKPAEEYSETRHNELIGKVEQYKSSVLAYEYAKEKARDAAARVQGLAPEMQRLTAQIEFSWKIERALERLPSRELEIQTEHLAMPNGYQLTTADGLSLLDSRGCPYELLSAGETMRADVELCLKVSSLMKRPVRMIFLDNADLADWVGSWQSAEGHQLLWATVSSEAELTVTHEVR